MSKRRYAASHVQIYYSSVTREEEVGSDAERKEEELTEDLFCGGFGYFSFKPQRVFNHCGIGECSVAFFTLLTCQGCISVLCIL